jgi:hypothetical protein
MFTPSPKILLVLTLAMTAGPAFADCPAGMQGSSSFTEAQATLDRQFGEKLVDQAEMVGKKEGKPSKAVFINDNGILKLKVIISGKEIPGGPFETFICSSSNTVLAVVTKTPIGDLPIPIKQTADGVNLSSSALGGSQDFNHIGGAR